ncbi:MAG TPA: PAS domain S-box protein [Herpetosiphonaceae bacterium]
MNDQPDRNGSDATAERRMQTMVASMPGVVWEAWGQPDAASQRVDFISDGIQSLLGYTVDEWLATPNFWLKIIAPEDQERASAEVGAIYASGGEGSSQFRWLASDGRALWVETHARAILDEQGAPVGLRGVTLDISARKAAEERLGYFAAVLENSPDFIALDTAKGEEIFLNSAAKRMMGMPADAGRPADFVARAHPAWAVDLIMNEAVPAAMRDGVWRGESAILRADGSEIPVSQVLIAHRDGAGELSFFSTVARDITEQKEHEELARKLQEEIIQMQATALAELSTPLIPVLDQVVVMPLIGAVDSQRSQSVIETLLEGVVHNHARVAILDITGVPVVDTQVASALIRAAQAVRLLGADVVLTGIKPEVAQTLVGLGVDLSGITTQGSLQMGISYAMGLLRR